MLAGALLLVAARASAAGFEIPENGAEVLARGGVAAGLLGAAYKVSDSLSFGATVELLYANLKLSQAMATEEFGSESPSLDAIANVAVKATTPTIIAGALFEPVRHVLVSLSLRPPVTVDG